MAIFLIARGNKAPRLTALGLYDTQRSPVRRYNNLSILEYRYAEGRQLVGKGEGMAVAFFLHCPVSLRAVCALAAVFLIIAVKD